MRFFTLRFSSYFFPTETAHSKQTNLNCEAKKSPQSSLCLCAELCTPGELAMYHPVWRFYFSRAASGCWDWNPRLGPGWPSLACRVALVRWWLLQTLGPGEDCAALPPLGAWGPSYNSLLSPRPSVPCPTLRFNSASFVIVVGRIWREFEVVKSQTGLSDFTFT